MALTWNGNTIPASTDRGSIVVSGPQDETQQIDVSLNAAAFSVRGATCNDLCQQCNGYFDVFMDSDSLNLAVGASGIAATRRGLRQRKSV